MVGRLTQKNWQFVNAIVAGKTQTQAYLEAYDTKGHMPTVYAEASRTARLPQVRQAILNALISQKATPEFAVIRLKWVADQNENYGAKRAACKDILDLWGIGGG